MPPSLEVMEDLIKQRQVTISLSDVDEEESFSHRIITLKSPDWSIEIGRGNSLDQGTVPGPDNAWFTSKVVSRHHATIKAHPRSMILTIEDNNSMHGTYLNGATVKREAVELLEGDVITFGTDIVRHAETFSPLKTRITYEWMEEDSPPEARPVSTRNTFTADYSDQDIFSDIDDEVEIVRETLRQPSVEIVGSCFTKPVTATSSTHSPSTNSVKSAGASSATTTHIDLSVDEDEITTKPVSVVAKSIGTFVGLDESEEDDMDDYSDHLSVDDIDDEIAEDSEAEENPAPKPPMPSVSSVLAAEKSPREPSPSDAALPALRSAPPPKFQSVPSLASLMPPPPPSLLSPTNDETYRPSFTNMSSFNRGFCGFNDVNQITYQNPPPIAPSAPFGYDFTSMSPPSPLRAPSFTNYGSSWAYPSLQIPQPPTWTASAYNNPDGMYRPNKRKADSISSESEDDFDSDPEPYVSKSRLVKADILADLSDSPVVKEPTLTEKAEAVIEDTEVSEEPTVATLSAPQPEAVPIADISNDSDQEMLLTETEAVEPPRKRLRVTADESGQRGSTMRTVAKYAATASAGAVVGAVGVIIGLASLPPDYFV